MSNCVSSLERELAQMPMPRVEDVDCQLAKVSLYHFVRCLWPAIERKSFVSGWHLEAICDHLEAVSDGRIRRLIINIPPRHTKSIILSMWTMWDWLSHPGRQWLTSSYAAGLSIRDNVKARRLFQSDFYQEMLYRHQPNLVLVGDQNTKTRFENSENGYRLATSVDGALTGEGGDIVAVDDPHNIRDGESESIREGVLQWWDESMSTRLNDPKVGAYVLIMQRSHQKDLTGHILEREPGEWDHLCLPARYEGNRVVSSLGFRDIRTVDRQPLCPERFGEEELTWLERRLGSYATAAQLQQRPSPRGGGMLKVSQVTPVEGVNAALILKSVRYWDKAGTEGGGARSAGVLMHLLSNERVVIEDVVKGQWSYAEREDRIKQTALMDLRRGGKNGVQIWMEQEPGSGGKESAERTVKMLRGFDVHREAVSGDKVLRARPFSAYMENGQVSVVQGAWVADYLAELEMFPNGKFKDQADASSGAFNKLSGLGDNRPATAGVWGRR